MDSVMQPFSALCNCWPSRRASRTRWHRSERLSMLVSRCGASSSLPQSRAASQLSLVQATRVSRWRTIAAFRRSPIAGPSDRRQSLIHGQTGPAGVLLVRFPPGHDHSVRWRCRAGLCGRDPIAARWPPLRSWSSGEFKTVVLTDTCLQVRPGPPGKGSWAAGHTGMAQAEALMPMPRDPGSGVLGYFAVYQEGPLKNGIAPIGCGRPAAQRCARPGPGRGGTMRCSRTQLDFMERDPKDASPWPGTLRDYGRHTDRSRFHAMKNGVSAGQRLFRWAGMDGL